MEKFSVKSPLEMSALARRLSMGFHNGSVLDLRGEMGAGKTVFAKGVCEGLGVLQLVTSPTFAIMNEYDARGGKVYHFDFYRIADESEAEELGLTEHFGDYDAVCIVEWGLNVKSYLPKNAIRIDIVKTGENEREVTVHD